MTPRQADIDYMSFLKRAFEVATRAENLVVLFLGAAIVVLGGIFSGFLLAGPLGVGYADACAKVLRGQRAELDDIFWRGFERLVPSMVAGFITMLAAAALLFMLFVPGALALYFGAVVFCVLAFDDEVTSGLDAIQKVWTVAVANPGPLLVMGIIVGIIGALLSLTVVGAVVMIALVFIVAVLTYEQLISTDPSTSAQV